MNNRPYTINVNEDFKVIIVRLATNCKRSTDYPEYALKHLFKMTEEPYHLLLDLTAVNLSSRELSLLVADIFNRDTSLYRHRNMNKIFILSEREQMVKTDVVHVELRKCKNLEEAFQIIEQEVTHVRQVI